MVFKNRTEEGREIARSFWARRAGATISFTSMVKSLRMTCSALIRAFSSLGGSAPRRAAISGFSFFDRAAFLPLMMVKR
jgi:hypothetical protein